MSGSSCSKSLDTLTSSRSGEATAPTQDKATSIAGFLRVAVLHLAYPDQVATAGNLALPLTPLDNPIGPVFDFTIYHLMDIEGEQVSLFHRKTYNAGKVMNGHTVIPKGGDFVCEPLDEATLGPRSGWYA